MGEPRILKCGDCKYWMCRYNCPREPNVNNHMNMHTCKEFKAKRGVVTWMNAEIINLSEARNR